MGKVSQKAKVLNHLQNHRCITSMEAFSKYGATRLSAIIFDLKKEGYLIKATSVTKRNKEGNSCTYAEYSLMTEGDFGSENK